MNINEILKDANVPEEHHANIISQVLSADTDSRGMFRHKFNVRILKAKKISKMFRPDVERLIDIDPKYLDWDVAPVDSVTCNGDNNPWGYKYVLGSNVVWIDPGIPEERLRVDSLLAQGYTTDGEAKSIPVGIADPKQNPKYESEKARAYWSDAKYHQRTPQSWKIWYRRNGGEGYAWRLGLPVELDKSKDIWVGKTYTVRRIGNVYQISGSKKLFWKLALNYSIGYELANVWDFKGNFQRHKPIDGYELKAALTWSILPGKLKKQGE